MSFKMVVDSCCELPEELKKDERFISVPLELFVGDIYNKLDDENFNQAEFLKAVASCPICPKSACPSPERYMEAYKGADHIYVVTLSSELSGSYNSAELGKRMYVDKYGEKNIHVFNSRSASGGETQVALKVRELEEKGMSFDEIVEAVEDYIQNTNTYFTLNTLEMLRKNGRLTGVKALVATTLNIKPVMGATHEGVIVQRGQAIGINKALQKMTDIIVKEVKNPQERRLIITHCNCSERAEYVKKMLMEKAEYKEVIVMDTAGISSLYAADGGIIVTL